MAQYFFHVVEFAMSVSASERKGLPMSNLKIAATDTEKQPWRKNWLTSKQEIVFLSFWIFLITAQILVQIIILPQT